MRIVIKNEYGEFEIGGSSKSRLLEITGIGIVGKETEKKTFVTQPGSVTVSTRDTERTISFSFDFWGTPRTVERLYKIIYHPVELWFYLDYCNRKISGILTEATDITNIIYRKWQSVVLQFVCDDPYFHNLYNVREGLATITDNFPNIEEGGEWLVELPAIATLSSARKNIKNDGSTRTYPKLYIKNLGQASGVTNEQGVIIANHTTGKKITIHYEITADDMLTVDVAKRRITNGTGDNITNFISDDTVLSDFYLKIGDNDISVSTLNDDNILTVDIEYNNNYIAAVI